VKRPRSLPDRLDNRNIADPITTYREDAPATAHGLVPQVSTASCTSPVSPTSPTPRATKATPTATRPQPFMPGVHRGMRVRFA
jgi:hypothetical protein